LRQNALKDRLDALSTEHHRLERRHENLSGRHEFISHRHDALTARYDTLSVDQDDLLDRYDYACASHDAFRERAHKQLRLCYDRGVEAQRNLVITVEETKNTLQGISDQLTTVYRRYPRIRPQGYIPWQRPPPPAIVPPIDLPSSAGVLMYRAREKKRVQELMEQRRKSRDRMGKQKSTGPASFTATPCATAAQGAENFPLSALFEQAQNIALPPDVARILNTYNAPPFVRILALIALHVPGINVWRLIRSARLEENHGCDIIATADISYALRHARGDSPSSDSESESDGEPLHIPSVSSGAMRG
jgi:hypothetical protein